MVNGVKQRRNDIYEIKEDIYSANIEKSKLNEKLYTLNEMLKKVDDGYNHYKEVSDRVDSIKSIKDVMSFKNVNLKSRIPAKRGSNANRSISYGGTYVTKEKIIGKAIFTYFPFSRWGMVQ